MKNVKKHQCNNCNKFYDDIIGAFNCSCQNKMKWNYPKRGSRQPEILINKLIKKELNEESRRHEELIKRGKLE